MTFGDYDVDKFSTSGELNWVKLTDDEHHWSVMMDELRFVGEESWTTTQLGLKMF